MRAVFAAIATAAVLEATALAGPIPNAQVGGGGFVGTATSNLDLDGTYDIIIDADGNSRIESGTGNQLHLYLDGSQQFKFSGAEFNMLGARLAFDSGQSGVITYASPTLTLKAFDVDMLALNGSAATATLAGTLIFSGGPSTGVDLDGRILYLSADGDDYIHAGTEDTIQTYVDFDKKISVTTGGVEFVKITQTDLTAGSCSAGEFKIDTGGATKELCYCQSGNVWYCWSATTLTGPTD